MSKLDAVRYFVALLFVVTTPPGVLAWFVVHPLARFWRRLGPAVTYSLLLPLLLLAVSGLILVRRTLLATEYGFRWPLAALALASYACALVVEVRSRRLLSLRVLLGVPELSRDDPGELLTQGIYGHIRNPRYLAIGLTLLAVALFTNYLASWLLLLLCLPAIHLVVLLEERELRARFGRPYERYLEQVPRYLPRLRRAG